MDSGAGPLSRRGTTDLNWNDSLMKAVIGVVGSALGLFGSVGPLKAQDRPDFTYPHVIAAGKALYLKNRCAQCHGAAGDGGVNLTKRDLGSPNVVFEAIADGCEKGALRMPAYRGTLSDAEMRQITAYVLSLTGKTN